MAWKDVFTKTCLIQRAARLVSADSSSIKLWDASTGEELRTLEMLDHRHLNTTFVYFTSDNNRLITGSSSGTINFWNASIIDTNIEDSIENNFLQFKFSPKPRWHQSQLRSAKSRRNWHATMFHLACLLRLYPDDCLIFDHLHNAYQQIAQVDNGYAQFASPIVSESLNRERGTTITPTITTTLFENANKEEMLELVELSRRIVSLRDRSNDAYLKALVIFETCCDRPDSHQFSFIWELLGIAKFRTGDFDGAILSLTTTLVDTDFVKESKYVAFLAMSHIENNDIEEAAKFCESFNKSLTSEAALADVEFLTFAFELRDLLSRKFESEPDNVRWKQLIDATNEAIFVRNSNTRPKVN